MPGVVIRPGVNLGKDTKLSAYKLPLQFCPTSVQLLLLVNWSQIWFQFAKRLFVKKKASIF